MSSIVILLGDVAPSDRDVFAAVAKAMALKSAYGRKPRLFMGTLPIARRLDACLFCPVKNNRASVCFPKCPWEQAMKYLFFSVLKARPFRISSGICRCTAYFLRHVNDQRPQYSHHD